MHSRQSRLVGLLSVLVVLPLILFLCPPFAMAEGPDISTALQEYLEAREKPGPSWVECGPVCSKTALGAFYSRRGYKPIWISNGKPNEAAGELVASLGLAERHGLSGLDYHHACLSQWLKAPFAKLSPSKRARELAELEVMLSDAFVNFADHLANGKVDPVSVYPHWGVEKEEQGIFEFLAWIRTAQDVRAALKALAPVSDTYRSAMTEADRLRQVTAAGGWPAVPEGKTLRKGDRSPRIIPLRDRLIKDGYLPETRPANDQETIFDPELESAVIRFQSRHGLVTDGVVGRYTLAELNRSPEYLIQTVLVNLERLRWLPRNLGQRHILVNVAAFSLAACEKDQQVLGMRIIVGEVYTQTPTFSRNMAYLVFNPYWNVPHGILCRKILPKIKRDPAYISKNHFELIKGWKEPPVFVDPATIERSRVRADNFPGRLRQRPGPWNSLGRIKFIFPNRFSVYLHDTPERHLFQRTVRTFSSGCIRVEKPVELAAFVLGNASGWDQNRINDLLADGKTRAVPVQDDVAVHLVYWTFWVDGDGKAHYQADIYHRDRVLWKALHAFPGAELTQPPRVLPELDPNMGVEIKG